MKDVTSRILDLRTAKFRRDQAQKRCNAAQAELDAAQREFDSAWGEERSARNALEEAIDACL